MQYNIQTDKRWKAEIMTACDGNYWNESWIDLLGVYGCLVVSIANIIQFFIHQEFTPKNLNDYFKIIKAYEYLNNPQHCREKGASFIIWDKVKAAFRNSFEITNNIIDYHNVFEIKYIARVINYGIGHYINVLDKYKEYYWCFDVWDGKLKQYHMSDILALHRFQYLGGMIDI